MYFVWDDWNVAHIATYDVDPAEAEYLVLHARRPYPRRSGPDQFIVKGATETGRWLQVIYVLRPAEAIAVEEVDPDDLSLIQSGEPGIYVIHARDLARGERP